MSQHVQPAYVGFIQQLEQRRLTLGWTTVELEARSGLGEGQYQKILHADASSGRQACWPTLQLAVSALFPGGFRIKIQACDGVPSTPLGGSRGPNMRRHWLRRHLMQIGQLQTRESRREAMLRLPSEQRQAMARHAANVRWARIRAAREAAAKTAREMAKIRWGRGSAAVAVHQLRRGD